MVSPSDIGNMFSRFMMSGGIAWMKYLMWGVYAVVIFSVLGFFWYISQFQIKCTEFPMYGSGKDGIFSVGKKRFNRFRWVKKNTAWNPMMPLFNRKEIEPFDDEYIYPGKTTFAFVLNGIYIPGRINISVEYKDISKENRIKMEMDVLEYLKEKYPDKEHNFVPGVVNINKSEGDIRAEINPVPYYWRNWQSLQHKKNAQEFAEQNWWADNKYFVALLITAIAVTAMVTLSVWFNFKYVGDKGIPGMNRLSSALENWDRIPGK